MMALSLLLLLLFALLSAWVADPWPVHLLRAGVFGLAVIWLVGRIRDGDRVRLHLWLAAPLLVVLVGACQIAAGRTVYGWRTWDASLGWLANAVFLFLALQSFSNAGQRDRWLRWFVLAGFGLCVLSILQLYTSDAKVFWTFTTQRSAFVLGTLGYKNHYAAFVELLFPVAIWQASRGRNRVVYIAMAGMIAASAVAAVSRAGVGLVILEFGACLLALRAQRRVSWRSAGLAAGVFTLAAVSSVGVFGWEQFWEKLHGGDDRMRIYAGAVDLIRERPWTGFGLGTWTTVYPAFAHFDEGLFMNAAHNDWLQWAGDGGLATAAVLLVLAASTLVRAYRSVWGIGIPVLFLHAVVDFPFQLPALAVTLFTLLGVLAAAGSAIVEPSELSRVRRV